MIEVVLAFAAGFAVGWVLRWRYVWMRARRYWRSPDGKKLIDRLMGEETP